MFVGTSFRRKVRGVFNKLPLKNHQRIVHHLEKKRHESLYFSRFLGWILNLKIKIKV